MSRGRTWHDVNGTYGLVTNHATGMSHANDPTRVTNADLACQKHSKEGGRAVDVPCILCSERTVREVEVAVGVWAGMCGHHLLARLIQEDLAELLVGSA